MFKWFLHFLGESNEKKLKKATPFIEQVNAFSAPIAALSDAELKNKTAEFKQRLADGDTLDDLLPEAFSVVREVAQRTVSMRPFDVQILGGVVLHQGNIGEMKTGEGKTLVATLPAYLNALTGRGVHIITVNDYLAARDAKWMGPVYEFLGLSVGVILSQQDYAVKKKAYACDITYGTNNEFGFDYLRDNMATHPEQCVQRELHYAIVDEVDSILIDEARTPLIISGQVEGSVSAYPKLYRLAAQLQKDKDYKSEEKQKNVILSEDGIAHVEKNLGITNLYDMANMDAAHILIQCLRAKEHYERDVDYVIKDGEIMIVDEFTGRLMVGRRYSDGLHQAIEAKENVKVKDENQTLASITFQNYFRMYEKLAGMTGTALTEAEEFRKIYNLDVLEIPTHHPCVRTDLSDVIYKSKEEKFKAVVNEIVSLHKKHVPVLVGTIAIETSELLSSMLKRYGVAHHVLNAKYHEKEAEIISQAGQADGVTIATNMAGRGTDIVLGAGVAGIGGLHIIGTERHESRRIDNQLRGRAGRQGDPGSTRFFVSLEDELMRLFGSDKIKKMMETFGLPDDTPIEHPWTTKAIERSQRKVEQYYFGIRKQVLEYDDVMNRQRTAIYSMRRAILEGKGIPEKLNEMMETVAQSAALEISQHEEDDSIETDLRQAIEAVTGSAESGSLAADAHVAIVDALQEKLRQREAELTAPILYEISRMIILRNLDSQWMEHLDNLDSLREGIGLRAYGQKDPLIEYKIEGFQMFKDMMFTIADDSLKTIYRVELAKEPPPQVLQKEFLEPVAKNIAYSGGDRALMPQRAAGDQKSVGRNDPCPCGSGKKYKKCCGA